MTAEDFLKDIEDAADRDGWCVAIPSESAKRLVKMIRVLAVIAGDETCVTPKAECPGGDPCDQCAIEYAYQQAKPTP